MRLPKVLTIAFALALFPAVWGCARPAHTKPSLAHPRPVAAVTIEAVPFFPQEAYQCGPASLAAVFKYWGHVVAPEEIADAVYVPRMKGTLSLDLWRYAMNHGFEARIEKGSVRFLASQLNQKRPVIAFLNLGLRIFPKGHFLVVVGLDPDRERIIAHSGLEREKSIPLRKFLTAWEKTGFWSLLVLPKEPA